MQNQTWKNVQVQEQDLHVGCTHKRYYFYPMCELCNGDSGSFKLWRTSIDTGNTYSYNICEACADIAAETFGSPIDRLLGTGLTEGVIPVD